MHVPTRVFGNEFYAGAIGWPASTLQEYTYVLPDKAPFINILPTYKPSRHILGQRQGQTVQTFQTPFLSTTINLRETRFNKADINKQDKNNSIGQKNLEITVNNQF